MANYKFGPGYLFDYYNGSVTRSPAFTGFPQADFNDFDSGVYVSPAIEVDIVDLARWFWRVKSWTVVFDSYYGEDPINISPLTQTFSNPETSEFSLLDQGANWDGESGNSLSFGIGVVISNAGSYGLQTDMNIGGGPLANLYSASGAILTFSDGMGHNITATESTYWTWA